MANLSRSHAGLAGAGLALPAPATELDRGGSLIYTIGHSTRPAGELLEILGRAGVTLLVDVRRYPGSRRHPQYNREVLAGALHRAGIQYRHAAELGGRRDADVAAGSGPVASEAASSPNAGWGNSGFRVYADYMATPVFREALDRLVESSREWTVAIMCAEAVPWRCHRNLISDALVARGEEVRHLTGSGEPRLHELNPLARVVEGGGITYPAEEPEQRELFS